MRADAAVRRQKIIDAAEEVFGSGDDQAPLEEIAKRAGVGIATLYRNFPDRASLIGTVIEKILKQLLQLQDDTERKFASDPSEAWEYYARGLISLQLPRALASPTAALADKISPTLSKNRQLIASRNENIVSMARSAGLVGPAIAGNFFFIGLLTMARPYPDTFLHFNEDFSEQLLQTFLKGLR